MRGNWLFYLSSLARVLVDRDPVLARAIDLIFVVEGDCPISHNVGCIEIGFSLQAFAYRRADGGPCFHA